LMRLPVLFEHYFILELFLYYVVTNILFGKTYIYFSYKGVE